MPITATARFRSSASARRRAVWKPISSCSRNLPDDTGMAFVLIQHLDPHHESRLVDLLARSTSMPVSEAAHGERSSPTTSMSFRPTPTWRSLEGRLQLTPRAETRGLHLPMDFFFRSLAEDQKSRAIGVVLSGTGSDGAQGVCEIKAMGGITFAQKERSAKFSRHAAQRRRERLRRSHPGARGNRPPVGADPHPPVSASPMPPAPLIDEDGESQYRKILNRVRAVTGVDFSLYRDTTIKRRIMRRMALHTHDTPWRLYRRAWRATRKR